MPSINALSTLLLLVVSTQAENALSNFIKDSLQKQKGLPDLDPLRLPDAVKHIQMGLTDMTISLTNIDVTHLSKYDARFVKADLENHRLAVDLAIPILVFSGTYDLRGDILGQPLEGGGELNVAVMDITASVTASINVTADGHPTLVDVQTRLFAGSTSCYLQHLALGGTVDLTSSIVKQIGDFIFEENRHFLEDELSQLLVKAVNKALEDYEGSEAFYILPPNHVWEIQNASEYIDQMLAKARPDLMKANTISLPEETWAFSKKLLFVTVKGEVKVHNGSLKGFGTLHRVGNAEYSTSADGGTSRIKASLGLHKLHGQYKCHVKFMGLGPNADVSVEVPEVEVTIHISKNFITGGPTVLEYLHISKIGHIDLNFDGLGPLDWIIKPLGGWIINLIKPIVVDAVEGTLRNLIAKKLQDLNIGK